MANMASIELYTDESPGLKVDPVVVLVLSVGFIISVVALHSTSLLTPSPFLLFLTITQLSQRLPEKCNRKQLAHETRLEGGAEDYTTITILCHRGHTIPGIMYLLGDGMEKAWRGFDRWA